MYQFKSQYDEMNLDLSDVEVRISADDHGSFNQDHESSNDERYSIHCEKLD